MGLFKRRIPDRPEQIIEYRYVPFYPFGFYGCNESQEDVKLHGAVFPTDAPHRHWWACSEPERLFDEGTAIDWRCQSCVERAGADLKAGGNDKIHQKIARTGERQQPFWTSEGVVIARNTFGWPEPDDG